MSMENNTIYQPNNIEDKGKKNDQQGIHSFDDLDDSNAISLEEHEERVKADNNKYDSTQK